MSAGEVDGLAVSKVNARTVRLLRLLMGRFLLAKDDLLARALTVPVPGNALQSIGSIDEE